MRFPIGDWQFWIVTLAAAAVLVAAARPLLRGVGKRARSRRVNLTVDRRKPGR